MNSQSQTRILLKKDQTLKLRISLTIRMLGGPRTLFTRSIRIFELFSQGVPDNCETVQNLIFGQGEISGRERTLKESKLVKLD